MIIVPAIDLRGGRCVRLQRGDPTRETRYDDDPIARAKAFVAAGAERIHVVDLDGALGSGENLEAIARIAAAVDVPVQTGGGIRTDDDIRQRFSRGVEDVILGTLLVEAPETARIIVAEHAPHVIAGIDARGTRVAVRGWSDETDVDRDTLIRDVASWGATRVVYTEIARDGMGSGYDIAALAHVAGVAPIRVTASGGAKTIDDLRSLVAGCPANVDHAIVGRALYEGTIDLAEAIAAVRVSR
jgi:phosphoribosylformimino-5-aminoimidazole carboxamide ribotide isomerase